jgi:DUF4097 and DUF4098 domain-containing protein YvlB
MRHSVLVFIFAVTFAACATTAQAGTQAQRSEGAFDRTLNVSGAADLDVSTGSGSIDIRQGTAAQVVIHGRIRAGSDWFGFSRDATDTVREIEANPPIEQNGNSIRVGRLRDSIHNVSISYEIVVPAGSSVRSHSGSGSQHITGIGGPVEVNTGSGSITLSDARGQVTAGTGSGSITVSGLRGEFRAHTGSGGIRVEGEQTGRWEMETGSGGIDVRLPKSAAFDLNAHTGSGGVSVDFPMTVQGRIDGRARNVSGRVGNGGYALDLRTGSGHIRIE